MIEEISPNLYRIEVPLPQSPMQATNSYLINGGERSLIIDTGMNRPECFNAMSAGLQELRADLKKTDFFITHIHVDHLGLVSRLATATSVIYLNRPDMAWTRQDSGWERNLDFALINGFPEDECRRAIENHPARLYSSNVRPDFHIPQEGNTITIGDYFFRCVATPGHTLGHMCLYDPNKKILLSGDHLLIDITPNVSLWSDDENPLEQYLESLDKVAKLDVKLVLPGHRSIFADYRGRIEELRQHHHARAGEVLTILENGKQNAFQIASQMTWDMDYKSWEQFPASQKWFAFGEAVSHLKYLEEKGMIQKERQQAGTVFALK